VPEPTATLEELLKPLRDDPSRAAVLLDVDGVLAPIVAHPDDAHMPETTRRPLIDVAKRYGVAGKILLSRLRTFLAFPEWFYLSEPVNTMTPPRPTPGGLATQFSSAGHFDLGEDQALIVTVPAAGREVAPYQGIQLGSMWYVSLDYVNHQTSLTRAIFFSALTTATAFGSLWLSSHPGTASMGKLLALSLVTTLAAVLLFQPALMGKPRDIGE